MVARTLYVVNAVSIIRGNPTVDLYAMVGIEALHLCVNKHTYCVSLVIYLYVYTIQDKGLMPEAPRGNSAFLSFLSLRPIARCEIDTITLKALSHFANGYSNFTDCP